MRAVAIFGLVLMILHAAACDDATQLERERQEREQEKAKRPAERTPPPPPTLPENGEGIWISRAEVSRLPMRTGVGAAQGGRRRAAWGGGHRGPGLQPRREDAGHRTRLRADR